jgi:hypothetical protein
LTRFYLCFCSSSASLRRHRFNFSSDFVRSPHRNNRSTLRDSVSPLTHSWLRRRFVMKFQSLKPGARRRMALQTELPSRRCRSLLDALARILKWQRRDDQLLHRGSTRALPYHQDQPTRPSRMRPAKQLARQHDSAFAPSRFVYMQQKPDRILSPPCGG